MDMELIAWLVVRDGGGRILLGRRCGTGLGEGLWNLPGGHIETGERSEETAAREAAEEVGLLVAPAMLRLVGLQRYDLTQGPRRVRGYNYFYEAAAWSGTPQPGDRTSETGWFAPEALPPDCLPWLPAALRRILAGQRYFEDVDALSSARSPREVLQQEGL